MRLVLILLVFAALVAAGCGGGDDSGGSQSSSDQPGKGKPSITIGDKNFTEDVDAADVFTTDAQLTRTKLTILQDTKHIFGFQNVAPVVSRKTLAAEGPEFAKTLNAVSGKLTIEAMQAMNAAVDIDKKEPKDVAAAFLEANGLK